MTSNRDRALDLCRGSHQRRLVEGVAYLGSRGLKGKAKNYAGKYYLSGMNLLDRLHKAGIPHTIEMGPRGGSFSSKLHILEEGSDK